MSHWNHRVIKHTDKTVINGVEETETWHGIHEVFYDDAGHPDAYTENEVGPMGETLLDLSEDIRRFTDALSKPVLVHEDFFPTRESIHARDVEPDAVETTRIALNEAENAAWMALEAVGGKDTRAQDNVSRLLNQMLDGYDREHGTDSRPLSIPTVGTSSSADELIGKLQAGFTPVEDIGDIYPKEFNLADTFGRRPETGTGVQHEATLEEARAAKVKLLNRIKDEPWLKAVGLGHSFSGYNIQVRVDPAYDLAGAQLPLVVDDVQVCVEMVGNIKPRGEMKVFPAPVDRHVEAAQKEPGTEIPCPFCKGRVLPRKEWLTGTWCCTKQYKARGMQGY